MAIITNKNIQTNTLPGQATNNPVQNQALAQPASSPVVQIPVQIQPVQATQPVTAQPTTTANTSVPTTQAVTAQPNTNTQPATVTNQPNTNVQQPTVTAPVNYTNNAQSNIQTVNQPITTTSKTTGKITTWTPIRITNTDLSTSEGQYQSAYASTINELVNSILNARFEYNPSEDDLLQLAIDYSTQQTFESMNSKGILNSSMTGERVAKVISDLTYQYQELARDEFENEFNRMLNVANLMMTLDQNEYQKFVDNRNYQYQLKQDEYQKQLDKISQTWNRVDTLGYVDNEASKILGLPVGTLSKDARERVEALQDELELYEKKLEMQQKSDIELYELKAQIDSMYGGSSSSSSSSNLSRYESIIQNSYATKNDYGQYTVGNVDNLYDFLEAENTSGRLSNEDAIYLINKYVNNASTYSSDQAKYYDEIIQNQYAVQDEDTKRYIIEDKDKMTVLRLLESSQNQGKIGADTVTYLLQKYGLSNATKEQIKYWMSLENK